MKIIKKKKKKKTRKRGIVEKEIWRERGKAGIFCTEMTGHPQGGSVGVLMMVLISSNGGSSSAAKHSTEQHTTDRQE